MESHAILAPTVPAPGVWVQPQDQGHLPTTFLLHAYLGLALEVES